VLLYFKGDHYDVGYFGDYTEHEPEKTLQEVVARSRSEKAKAEDGSKEQVQEESLQVPKKQEVEHKKMEADEAAAEKYALADNEKTIMPAKLAASLSTIKLRLSVPLKEEVRRPAVKVKGIGQASRQAALMNFIPPQSDPHPTTTLFAAHKAVSTPSISTTKQTTTSQPPSRAQCGRTASTSRPHSPTRPGFRSPAKQKEKVIVKKPAGVVTPKC
jgi:hypothetical protein